MQGSKLGNKYQLNYPHVIFRFADAIVRTPRILDVVEAIIGPDIMVWGATFSSRNPTARVSLADTRTCVTGGLTVRTWSARGWR